jgi:hypothetical protein
MADLILTRKPGNNVYTISGPVLLGRERVVIKNRDDLRREYTFEGEVDALKVSDEVTVSRNHLFLYPDSCLGGYRAVDLSENGTYLNGSKMAYKGSHSVDCTDTFYLGGVSLVVERVPYRRGRRFGLFVANDGRDLGEAVKNDMSCLGAEMRNRGFRWNTRSLLNASKELVLSSLDEIASRAEENSLTVFFFSGHGLRTFGLSMKSSLMTRLGFGSYISPDDLFNKLNQIKGKHAVILDCCNGGYFAENLNFYRNRTAVLAATSARGSAYPNAGDVSFGRFTEIFLRYCSNHRGSFSLNDQGFLAFLKKEISFYREVQEPEFAGCDFVLPGRI